jgi:hypothetical protein
MVASTATVAALDLLRWIPLIPLGAGLFNVFFGRRLGGKTAGAIATAAVGVSFGLAVPSRSISHFKSTPCPQ